MGKAPPGEFDWDASNLSHLARHGISREEFEEAMTHDPMFVDFDDRTGEERWYAVGATDRRRVLFLVFTFICLTFLSSKLPRADNAHRQSSMSMLGFVEISSDLIRYMGMPSFSMCL